MVSTAPSGSALLPELVRTAPAEAFGPAQGPGRTTTRTQRRRQRLAHLTRRLGREGAVVFCLTATAYLVLGLWLVLEHHVVLIDALARVGNASYVVSGRQPHLAAIGFVWNPLPSLSMVPLALLRPVLPALLELGLAATVTTALVMAAAVHQLHGLLRDAGLARAVRLLLTLLFAVHPMVAFYGGNGMSEAWLLLALAWAARRLARWLRTQRTGDLVACGLALAVAYLARYEAIAAAVAVPLLVMAHSWGGARGSAQHRRLLAVNDAVLVALPAAVAVTGWALVSWAIVGHPFETFQSPYGNSAQVDLAGGYITQSTGENALGRLAYVAEQVAWLSPCLAILVPMSLVVGVKRRGRHLLAPVATFGSVLAFQAAAFMHGDTFGWLRFSLCAVPLGLALGGLLAAQVRLPTLRIVAAEMAVAVTLVSAVTAWHPVLDPRLGREEAVVLLPVLAPARATEADRATLRRFQNERSLARWLDDQLLPEGSVLVDTAPGFAVVLASRRPEQFVITSDEDFEPTVSDPALSGVRLMLVQPTPADAINIAYPGIYEEGRPFVRLLRDFPARGVGVPWRVYEVIEHF